MNSFPSSEHSRQPKHPWEYAPYPQSESDEQKRTKSPEKEQKAQSHDKKAKPLKQNQKETGPKSKLAEESTSQTKEPTEEALKEKRLKAVERSAAYKKHFENIEIPKDPSTLARLLVADQILTIHDQLEHPDTHKETLSEPELLGRLDYFGNLADKLEDPAAQSSPEIEQAYTHVLQLAKDALEQGDSINTIIEAHQTAAELSLQAEPPASSDAPLAEQAIESTESPAATAHTPLTTATTVLIHALTNFKRPLAPNATLPHTIRGGSSSPFPQSTSSVDSSRITSSHSPPAHPHLSSSERPAPATKRSFRPLAALALGSAVAASIRDKQPAAHRSPFTSRHLTKEPPAFSSYPSRATHSIERTTFTPNPSFTSPPVSRPESAQRQSSSSETKPSSPKLEHLPLHSLLAMATTIPVGHGNYLRHVFEKGQLDKEGLIKVLKAHNKGRDVTSEYRQQTARYQYLRSSPEFLHGTQSPQTPPDSTMHDKASPTKAPEPNNQEDAQPKTPPSAPSPTPLISFPPSRLEHQTWPASPHPQTSFWLIAGAVVMILFGLVVVFMLVL